MPKKTTVKRGTKTTNKRTVAVETKKPEMHECHCGASCGCGCHCGKFKKFIVLLIVFILGFAVAKLTCCRGHRHMPKMEPKFENGCLVMDSIKCPKMLEDLSRADIDMNGCITRAEFDTAVKPMHHGMRDHHNRPERYDIREHIDD